MKQVRQPRCIGWTCVSLHVPAEMSRWWIWFQINVCDFSLRWERASVRAWNATMTLAVSRVNNTTKAVSIMHVSRPTYLNIIPNRVLINNTSCIMQCETTLQLIFEQLYKCDFCGDTDYTAVHIKFIWFSFFPAGIETWGDKTVMKQKMKKKWYKGDL